MGYFGLVLVGSGRIFSCGPGNPAAAADVALLSSRPGVGELIAVTNVVLLIVSSKRSRQFTMLATVIIIIQLMIVRPGLSVAQAQYAGKLYSEQFNMCKLRLTRLLI